MKPVPLSPRQAQIADLLLEGCGNSKEIAKELGIKQCTAKAHLNRLYMKYRITSGIKRVKLAVMLYRERNPQ